MSDAESAEMEKPSNPAPQYASYTQYIDECASIDSGYRWLQRFFSHPSPDISETKLTIFEAVEGRLMQTGQYTTRTNDLDRLLLSPTQGRLRLITVAHSGTWKVDRGIIDKLGLHFDVDPMFFRRHFYYYFQYVEDTVKPRGKWKYDDDEVLNEIWLPSEESMFEYHFSFTREYEKMSVLLCTDPGGAESDLISILCLIRYNDQKHIINREPRPSVFTSPGQIRRALEADLSTHYAISLHQLSEEAIACAERDPLRLSLPYTRNLVLLFSREHKESFDIDQMDNFDDGPSSYSDVTHHREKLYQLQFELAAIRKLNGELEKLHRGLTTQESRCLLDSQLSDLASVRKKFEQSAAHFGKAKQDALLMAQMKEAKASTRVAMTVNRLSKLAFVFIPLTFTTSVFGMNLRVFDQGTVSLSIFFITASLVSITSIIPLVPVIWLALQSRHIWETSSTVLRLLFCHPIGALQYLGLLFNFGYDITYALCGKSLHSAFRIRATFPAEQKLKIDVAEKRMSDRYLDWKSIQVWQERAKNLRSFADSRTEQHRPGEHV